uniref:Uncharacterized protein n=1 Tax=Knipowitschia caucasica TaxID=637954 RepID=A0AAV2MSM2_KNICA
MAPVQEGPAEGKAYPHWAPTRLALTALRENLFVTQPISCCLSCTYTAVPVLLQSGPRTPARLSDHPLTPFSGPSPPLLILQSSTLQCLNSRAGHGGRGGEILGRIRPKRRDRGQIKAKGEDRQRVARLWEKTQR